MKALGIILASEKKNKLGKLVAQRNIAAIPIGGVYRSIDFMLSNLSHSGIKKVAVIAQHNTRSLNDHISSAKWWGFGRKKSGLYLFTPHMINSQTYAFRGTADAIYQNIDFLKKSNEPYVVILSGEQIAKIDFSKVIERHKEKNADITIMCKNFEHYDIGDYGVMTLDDEGFMTDFEDKPLDPQQTIASMGIYVIGREKLIELLEELDREGRYDFVNDIIFRYRRKLKIHGYLYDGYWKVLEDVKSYYEVNMDLLEVEKREMLLNTHPYIYTKARDEAPAKFDKYANIIGSIIGGGSIVNGTVENSVLFRKVKVGDNAIIRNSIIMDGCIIESGAIIENAILDKKTYVAAGEEVIGTQEKLEINCRNKIS